MVVDQELVARQAEADRAAAEAVVVVNQAEAD